MLLNSKKSARFIATKVHVNTCHQRAYLGDYEVRFQSSIAHVQLASVPRAFLVLPQQNFVIVRNEQIQNQLSFRQKSRASKEGEEVEHIPSS